MQGKPSKVVLLTWYLVCGLSACRLFILSDTRKNSKKGLFLWCRKTLLAFQREGSKAWSRTPLMTSTSSVLSSKFGQEREMILEATTALWGHPFCLPTGGRELAESVGFVLAENSVLDNLPWVLGESLGVLSATGARQKFFMVSLSCTCFFHLHLHLHKRAYSPLTGIQNCTRLKPAHWLKWQLSKVICLGFFSPPRIMGFILK